MHGLRMAGLKGFMALNLSWSFVFFVVGIFFQYQ